MGGSTIMMVSSRLLPTMMAIFLSTTNIAAFQCTTSGGGGGCSSSGLTSSALHLAKESINIDGDGSNGVHHDKVKVPSSKSSPSPSLWIQRRLKLQDYEVKRLQRRLENKGTQLDSLSVEDQLEPMLFWLQLKLVYDTERLKELIFNQPKILTKSLEGEILPTLAWLEDNIIVGEDHNNAEDDSAVANKTFELIKGSSVKITDQILDDEHLIGMVLEIADAKRKQKPEEDPSRDEAILGDVVQDMTCCYGLGRVLERDLLGQLQPSLEYLRERLGLTDQDLATMIQKAPSTLGWNVDTIHRRITFLQDRLFITEEQLSKLIKKFPWVLGLNDKENIAPTLDYLQTRLKLDTMELSKIVQRMPELLGLSWQDNIEPKIAYLEKRLLLDEKGLKKLVKRLPTLLGYSQTENIEPKLKWIEERLNLNKKELSRVILTAPSIFSYSVTNTIQPSLDWLQKGLGLEDEDALRTLILTNPTLCGKNVDNLSTTFDFYEDILGKEDARKLITRTPALLTYSLKKRLLPRLQDVQEVGIAIDTGVVQRIAKYTNENWEKSIAHQTKQLEKLKLRERQEQQSFR